MSRTYDEAECLAIIDLGAEDAEDLLLREIPNARRRFNAMNKAMNAFLAEIQDVFPDACYYTASGGFNLLLGASHKEGINGASQQQLAALAGSARIGDGDW